MSALARPAALASILAAAAVALHPALGASRWLPARPALLAALLLLAALALVARAASAGARRPAALPAAAGAVLLVGALAVDGVRGHHGTLTLAAGQSQGTFDEVAPDGRSVGLRPLDFPVGAARVVAPAGSSGPRVALAFPGRTAPVELTPQRSVAFRGYRFARPETANTGGVALRVAASDGAATQVADVSPGAPGQAFGLAITLQQYFPDFALDEKQQPFSRSAEPRNPAALLTVERGGQAHRVFVLRSMPGIHRVEDLGLAFSLLGVEAERSVEVAVHREPAALAVLLGALLLAAGVALLSLGASPTPDDRGVPPALVGGALVGLLLLADRSAVLAWRFAVPGAEGRVVLPGVGVLLGGALVAALGGSLLLAAARLAGGEGGGARPAARGALWLAVGLGAAGLVLAVVRVAGFPVAGEALRSLAGLAAALAWLALSLVATRPAAPPLGARAASRALPLAVLAALGLAIAAGVSGSLLDGTYGTAAAAAAAASACLGLAALEKTRAEGLLRFAFLLALLALAAR